MADLPDVGGDNIYTKSCFKNITKTQVVEV